MKGARGRQEERCAAAVRSMLCRQQPPQVFYIAVCGRARLSPSRCLRATVVETGLGAEAVRAKEARRWLPPPAAREAPPARTRQTPKSPTIRGRICLLPSADAAPAPAETRRRLPPPAPCLPPAFAVLRAATAISRLPSARASPSRRRFTARVPFTHTPKAWREQTRQVIAAGRRPAASQR